MKNIYRIIFWGLIMIICLVSGILGILQNKFIFNSYEIELNYLVNTFNSSSIIRDFRVEKDVFIVANLQGKNVVIKYDGAIKTTYKYNLENGYLTLTYTNNDSFANTFNMLIADAISQYYGRSKGEIYSLFNDGTIYDYNFDSGIKYKIGEKKTTILLNLNTPVNLEYEK